MKVNRALCLGLLVLLFGAMSEQAVFAQKFEVHPYAGGFFNFWDYDDDQYVMRTDGVYGVKGGGFLSDRIELEGHWGWMPHMEFEGTDPGVRGMIWEIGPSFNFFSSDFGKAVPYLTLNVGGLTGYVGDLENTEDRDLIFQFRGENDSEIKAADILFRADRADLSRSPRSLVLEDGDTFFAFSYGGGIKGINLWGPVGLRGDVRARTMPNFYGKSLTWLETTGGITFTWGER